MNKVLEYFKNNLNEDIINKNIKVYGWQGNYNYQLIGSITKYLFEDLDIIENLAPLTNENREGIKKEKYYITVHDTGDSSPLHTAKFWSETVKTEAWEVGKYGASYQYVVGNDGVYQNIPDDEIAWHAGDSTICDYKLYKTGVFGNNEKPKVSINSKGYYTIDEKETVIIAPRVRKIVDGEVIYDRLGTDNDFNQFGVLCKLIDGEYYLGETYYNSGYEKICNRGGNNNSIGIESCVNADSDIYYTWQMTAKLVAYLMDKYNLGLDDVKTHHYFSGKSCPQTILENGFWNHFMKLVRVEYDVLQFLKEGYKIEFECLSSNISKNGRVNKFIQGQKIEYVIKTTKDGIIEEWKGIINL